MVEMDYVSGARGQIFVIPVRVKGKYPPTGKYFLLEKRLPALPVLAAEIVNSAAAEKRNFFFIKKGVVK